MKNKLYLQMLFYSLVGSVAFAYTVEKNFTGKISFIIPLVILIMYFKIITELDIQIMKENIKKSKDLK